MSKISEQNAIKKLEVGKKRPVSFILRKTY